MGPIESRWLASPERRRAIQKLTAWAAAAPALSAQRDPVRPHPRFPKLEELLSPLDFEPVAHARLPRFSYDYTAYGSDGEFTLRRNRDAFDWVKLIPSSSGAAAELNTATELFGTRLTSPLLISPTAAHVHMHPDGELATYQGATAANTPMIVSTNTSVPIEKIAPTAKGQLWFQLYPREDMESNREMLERAQAAGAKAIVVTIDQQAAEYERALHDRHLGAPITSTARRASSRQSGEPSNPYRIREFRLWYEWGLFAKLRPMIKVPMIAKGILTAEDARLCLEHGLDGVYVSNHGGRSIDYGPSTLEVLPEIAAAVNGRVPILFDSGVRRGSDALKALALGATAVCLGRMPRWGLGAYGSQGVQRSLELLQAELAAAMRYTGRTTLASIDRTLVRTDFP
ncbi:MAG: alpha-hydroxy-acid oxidizing protein [Acidobacteria bacterium]|nr:alpha-hydroxy-acid oxidizing protein [Acidobacteriota bacterium]